MKREPNWAKAVPGQPEIKENYVEEVVTTEREIIRGRIERAVIITTHDFEVARLGNRHDRVNWRGHSYILDMVKVPSTLDERVFSASIDDRVVGYQKLEVTLVAYEERGRTPFDYWNRTLSNNLNPRLWAVSDGRA